MKRILSNFLISVCLSLVVVLQAQAQRKPAPIDSSLFFTGKHAPPGAMDKLKQAAHLAALGNHCAKVTSGFWIPPKEQESGHQNEPWMITCKSTDNGFYNVYFSDADLSSAHKKDRTKPVSQSYAAKACRKAFATKFPSAKLKLLSGFEVSYDASTSTSNVLERIPVTVENAFGVRVERIVNCIITPDGRLNDEDVWLTKR